MKKAVSKNGKNGRNGKTVHGPEPERLKITGVRRWEDAVAIAVRKRKPAKGWPKK